MGEENPDEQSEHPAEDAGQQPEMGPPQLDQSIPTRTAGRRSPRALEHQTA
jgi:hypothetical protein